MINDYEQQKGYDQKIKQECLTNYANGMRFIAIERLTGVDHRTIITWVKSAEKLLPVACDPETPPKVGELDELETVVESEKQNPGLESRRLL